MPPVIFSVPVLLLHSQNCINIHVQLCIITDHGQHWDGVQWDGPWLQASHSQSQKNGPGCPGTLKSELLRSFAQCRTTTLCIMRRSPRRSWCTGWLSLCKSTPSQEGYEILTMFWLRYLTSHHIFLFHLCNDNYQVRPFGVSLLICGWDEPGKPLLFQVELKVWPLLYQAYILCNNCMISHFKCDPSGAYFAWKATAMGKNSVNGKTFLEKRWNSK